METVTIGYIVFGILIIVLLVQKFLTDKASENFSYLNERFEWSLLTSTNDFKLLSKYAGEIPFGPAFIHLKTEPKNVFNKQFFGDWNFKTENGIYLQKWSVNPLKRKNLNNAVSELIFLDFKTSNIKTIQSGIKAFWIEIEKNEYNELILVLNNVKSEERIKITETIP